MGADFIMVLAILQKLELLTAKEAKNLYEELKYKNLSMELADCVGLIEEAFKKHRIGQTPTSLSMTVDNKEIPVIK